jgi:hypothetical protein
VTPRPLCALIGLGEPTVAVTDLMRTSEAGAPDRSHVNVRTEPVRLVGDMSSKSATTRVVEEGGNLGVHSIRGPCWVVPSA